MPFLAPTKSPKMAQIKTNSVSTNGADNITSTDFNFAMSETLFG